MMNKKWKRKTYSAIFYRKICLFKNATTKW